MKIMTCADLAAAWRDDIDPSTLAGLQALLQALLNKTIDLVPLAVDDNGECWRSGAIHHPSNPTCLVVATVNVLPALLAEAQEMRESLARIKALAEAAAMDAKALGRCSEERRWLDVLAVLEWTGLLERTEYQS